jgi:hypothetical protein
MAILGSKYLDLIDLYKSQDKEGRIVPVIEMLAQYNPILMDAVWRDCNSGAQHLTTVRAGLPDVTWGRLYKGIPNSKSKRVQVTDTTGYVEGRSTVDARFIEELSGGKGNQMRLSEAQAFLESIGQETALKIFYGNDTEAPEEFMGLAPRFNSLSAANGGQIIDAGGTGSDNSSIWFVTWGDNQTSLLYPKDSFAGIKREDHGKQRVLDEDGNAYYAYEETFRQHIGLTVRDWRYVVRIANIDVPDAKDGDVDLYKFLRQAYYKLQNRRVPGGSIMMYCNRDILEALDALATNAGANDNFVRLTRKEVQGEEVLDYRGITIRETDALLNTEERVV